MWGVSGCVVLGTIRLCAERKRHNLKLSSGVQHENKEDKPPELCYIQHAWGWPSKSVSWKSRLFYSKICKLSKKVTCARTCTQCKKWKEHPERGRHTVWSNSFWDGTEDRGRGCPDPLMAIHNVILHSQSPLELFWSISHESEQLKWLACDHWIY